MTVAAFTDPTPRARLSRALVVAWLLIAALLTACGGGGGDDSTAGGGGGSTIGGGGTGGGGNGGGTGGGTGGGGSGQGTPPVLQSSPQSVIVYSGQQAVFRVQAAGSGLRFEWQERRSQDPWSPAAGQASTLAESSELTVTALASNQGETYYRALIRNDVGEVASAEARLDVVWGSVETFEPSTINFNDGGAGGQGGGDGGTAGGGDGGGVGAGGGLGKTLQVQIAVARTSDGAALGSARTGATSGLVRIKAAPGTAPVLLTLSGTDVGTYYDEGRKKLVPYGADQPPLHALVTEFDQHLGVTALTEAAYRYAINHFIADPDAIRRGAAPLRSSATAEEIARLTPAQIRQAQDAIRAEFNSKLPQRYQLVSIATLPTPVDGNSALGTITNNRYGIIQAVTGGLAIVAGNFDSSLDRPALTIAAQLADDLTDGVIDGKRLDGTPVSAGARAYDPLSFAQDLVSAADFLFNLLGGLVPLPTITVQPLSLSITEGGIATLSVQAEGPSLAYQWFAGGVAIAGARSPTYTTSAAGSYSVVVSNAAGAVTSVPATITVELKVVAPVITQQPVSLSITLGATATFSVEASGTDLSFQWFNANGPIANATRAILNTTLIGTYHVVVSNSAGSVRSKDVTLIALPLLGGQ